MTATRVLVAGPSAATTASGGVPHPSAPPAGITLTDLYAVLDEPTPVSFEAPMTLSEIVAWHWDEEGK